jgi:hypothetical protein
MNVEPLSSAAGERASHEEVSAMKRMPDGNGGGGP